MYDLPSEDPEEPGLPDEYHYLQPQLLSATFHLRNYAFDRVFRAGDLNLYYDVRHPRWYKCPDWFAVVNVPRLYEQRDLAQRRAERLAERLRAMGIDPDNEP
jgi:Uma2 family endonuclease